MDKNLLRVSKGGEMMERLTERIFVPKEERELVVFTQGEYIDTIPAEMTHEDIRKVLRKLAEYEDLEEIFRDKITDTACEFLKYKEEFGKWLDRNRWIAKKCDEYARAEEQGLLLRLPLKIGDTVYSVTRDFISEYTICSIEVYNEGFFFCWKCKKGIYNNVRGFTNYQIGRDIFLTQAEAEQKLKEMKSD